MNSFSGLEPLTSQHGPIDAHLQGLSSELWSLSCGRVCSANEPDFTRIDPPDVP